MAKIKKKIENEMSADFQKLFSEFETSIDPNQNIVIEEIKKIISVLDLGRDSKGFSSWGIIDLIRAKEKLSRYSEYLGEWISFHETHSDFSYIWRKGKMASDWQPVKTELENKLKISKITISEIESQLTEKYLSEQYYSMFHRRRADYLILTMETIDRMIRSIDSRLREMDRQFKLDQNSTNEEKPRK